MPIRNIATYIPPALMDPTKFDDFVRAMIETQLPVPIALDHVFDWLEINSVFITPAIRQTIGVLTGAEPREILFP